MSGSVTLQPTSVQRKVGTLGALYLAQGLPFGFFTQALPVLLREEGYSLGQIGLASLLAMPWALKFLWAPLVDRYGSPRIGRRKSWILPLQLLSAVLLLAVAARPGAESLSLLLGVVLLVNLLSATQDIATDGLAVDLLAPGERGLANGVQVAGYRVGMILGGGALLVLFERLGWASTFTAMAALVLLATLPIALTREQTTALTIEASSGPERRPVHFLRSPGAWRILALLVAYKLGDALATGMLRPFLSDAGLSLGDIGVMLGTVGFTAGLLGALCGGLLVGPLGRRRALLIFGGLQALTVAGYAYVAVGSADRVLLYAACAAEHFAGGLATAALFTCMMDWCRPGSSATDYTVQASAVVIATGLASSVSGFSAQVFGYFGHFALAAGFAALALVVVARLVPGEGHGSRAARRVHAPRVAVYAGTFDPVTAGHVSVIERAARVFDRVIVLIAINPQKAPMFSTPERLQMLREATCHLDNVEHASTEGLVVDHARAHGASFLVRGIRGATDADYETALANANHDLAPDVTTVFLPAHPHLSEVSSSRLKELARAGAELSRFCPSGVERRLRARLAAEAAPGATEEVSHVDV